MAQLMSHHCCRSCSHYEVILSHNKHNGCRTKWCRSVVKYGGQSQSDQAIKLFRITSCVNCFQSHNNPGSWQPAGAQKNSFIFHFGISLSSSTMWNLPITLALSERMWHSKGSKHTFTLLLYFKGVTTPQLPESTPLNGWPVWVRISLLGAEKEAN